MEQESNIDDPYRFQLVWLAGGSQSVHWRTHSHFSKTYYTDLLYTCGFATWYGSTSVWHVNCVQGSFSGLLGKGLERERVCDSLFVKGEQERLLPRWRRLWWPQTWGWRHRRSCPMWPGTRGYHRSTGRSSPPGRIHGGTCSVAQLAATYLPVGKKHKWLVWLCRAENSLNVLPQDD